MSSSYSVVIYLRESEMDLSTVFLSTVGQHSHLTAHCMIVKATKKNILSILYCIDSVQHCRYNFNDTKTRDQEANKEHKARFRLNIDEGGCSTSEAVSGDISHETRNLVSLVDTTAKSVARLRLASS